MESKNPNDNSSKRLPPCAHTDQHLPAPRRCWPQFHRWPLAHLGHSGPSSQPRHKGTSTHSHADLDWTKIYWPRVSQDRARTHTHVTFPAQADPSFLTHDKAYSQEPPMKANQRSSTRAPQWEAGVSTKTRKFPNQCSRHLLHPVPQHLGSWLALAWHHNGREAGTWQVGEVKRIASF